MGEKKVYDVIVVGGGPAGLSAALYAGRAKLSTLMLEKAKEGGQITFSSAVENYPAGIMGETGEALVARLTDQCAHFGVETVKDEATDLALDGKVKEIKCASGAAYLAKTIILATGNVPIVLGVPGEFEYVGRGVSYCATCDAPFFTDLDVYVVGGGDSAVEEALYIAKFARKVTIIHRRDELRAAKSIQEKAFKNEKIDFLWDSVVKEIKGGDLLESLVIENVKTGEISEVRASEEDGTMGLFVFIGLSPNTKDVEGKIELDTGYIVTDEEMRTNVPGVFAAGDVRRKSLRQVVTAAADGAIAAVQAERYMELEG